MFKRKEVMIKGEMFEVYFRDVIECIRSLFGNESFARYLKFVPEKHYTSEREDEQLFHDMYTGQWWWSTQVCTCSTYSDQARVELITLLKGKA